MDDQSSHWMDLRSGPLDGSSGSRTGLDLTSRSSGPDPTMRSSGSWTGSRISPSTNKKPPISAEVSPRYLKSLPRLFWKGKQLLLWLRNLLRRQLRPLSHQSYYHLSTTPLHSSQPATTTVYQPLLPHLPISTYLQSFNSPMISKALQRKQIPQELSTVSTTTKTSISSFYSSTREMSHSSS
jgi:hypothetical protein